MMQLPPGLAGFVQHQQQAQQEEMGQLQQAQAIMAIRNAQQQQAAQQQAQARAEKVRQAIANSGGDVEKALQAVLSTGDTDAAKDLYPLVRLAQERKQREETVKGMRELFTPPPPPQTNPMAPGPGASIMAGSGSTTPTPPAPVSPDVQRQDRLRQLHQMSVMYANNPTVLAQIQRQISDLNKPGEDKPISSLGKLIAERDALRAKDPSHPDIKIYDQAITKYQPGGVTVNLPPNAPLIPGKPAQTKVDEGLLDAGMRLQRLTAIESQFKPEYQQIGTKWDALKMSWRDKSGLELAQLSTDERRFLTDFSKFRRNSYDALNEYIKSITGAAMTNAEADRILKGLPNPGTGIFDGDSPTEFKAKLDDAMRQIRMAEARFVYIKRNGLTLGDVSLDRMPRLMNERGAALEVEIKQKQPEMSATDVRKMVRRNLAQEFGLAE